MLSNHPTKENSGEVKGFGLLYSGNFQAQVCMNTMGSVRVNLGMLWLYATNFAAMPLIVIIINQALIQINSIGIWNQEVNHFTLQKLS